MLTNEEKRETEDYFQELLDEQIASGSEFSEYQTYQFRSALGSLLCGSYVIACAHANAMFDTNVADDTWVQPGSKVSLDDLQKDLDEVKQSPVQESLVRFIFASELEQFRLRPIPHGTTSELASFLRPE